MFFEDLSAILIKTLKESFKFYLGLINVNVYPANNVYVFEITSTYWF